MSLAPGTTGGGNCEISPSDRMGRIPASAALILGMTSKRPHNQETIRESEDSLRDDLLTPSEVAVMLGVAPKTLRNWRSSRVGPLSIRLGGGVVRYRRGDIADWLAGQVVIARAWMAD